MAPAARTARSLALAAGLFVVVGLLLYLLLYAASERLLLRHGHLNPFFKIQASTGPAPDWLVLGASHAMVLDFDDIRAVQERGTGRRLLNLAATGTGPLYQRFVLEHYLAQHGTANVLYFVDSFAFSSRAWNEARFADPKLLARTPWDPALAGRMWRYAATGGVDRSAWLNYVSGFAKVNNRDRFEDDRWEGERQFDSQWRVSSSAVKKRMAYLYPDGAPEPALDRYLADLKLAIEAGRASGARVVLAKLPLPEAFRSQLPAEERFDDALQRLAAQTGAELHDWTTLLPQPQFYFDSDHLNRAGVMALFQLRLRAIYANASAPPQ